MAHKTAPVGDIRLAPEVDLARKVAPERPRTRHDAAVEHCTDEWSPSEEGPPRHRREQPFPSNLQIAEGRRRRGVIHGFHSKSAIALSNPMGCDTCVLSAIKKKNPRHPLACNEARKHARCSILERHQADWAAGLVEEIRNGTGQEPTAIQRGQVEQILRLRGRLFALEVYLSAAGLVDVRTGEPRAIVDRMTSLENALGRATGELRASIAAAREAKRGGAPRLAEYLAALASKSPAPLAVEDASSKEIATDAQGSFTERETDGDEQ